MFRTEDLIKEIKAAGESVIKGASIMLPQNVSYIDDLSIHIYFDEHTPVIDWDINVVDDNRMKLRSYNYDTQ